MNLFSNNNGYSTGEIYWNEQPINKIFFRDNIIFQRIPRIDFILPCLSNDNIVCEEGNYDRYYWNEERAWSYYSINYVRNYLIDEGEEEDIPEYENIFNNFYNNYNNYYGVYPIDPLIEYHGLYNSSFNNEQLLNLFMFQTGRLNNETYNYTILNYDGDYVQGLAESSVVVYKTLNQYISNYYNITNTVKLINNTSQMVALDGTENPINYKWFNYVYNDNANGIQVSIAAPYGNYIDPFNGDIVSNIYLGIFEEFPLYFYCENSNKIYYNSNPFGGEMYLDQSDLTQGPKYDYVNDTEGIYLYPGSEYINVNFKRITEFNNYFYPPYSLKLPLKVPYVTNLTSAYYSRQNLQKAWCGDHVVNMHYTYYGCQNLTKPVCGNNVIDFSGAYYACQNLQGKSVCGPNVTNMAYTYSYCNNITVPNIGPKVTNAYMAFTGCYGLKKIIILPTITNNFSGMYGINQNNIIDINIERYDSNFNIGDAISSSAFGYYRFAGSNTQKIRILGHNFSTFWNFHIDEDTGEWNYNKAINSYSIGPFSYLPLTSLREIYITDGFKDISNWFSTGGNTSLSNLRNCYIPNSVEVYQNTFAMSGVTHCLHNNNGGRFFLNTYRGCDMLYGEGYVPASAEYIEAMFYECRNLTSVNIDRECQIPSFNADGSYVVNNKTYSHWYHPIYGCTNLIDLKLSNYMINFYGHGCFTNISGSFYNGESQRWEYLKNYKLTNIVFYNNDNNTIKNLFHSFFRTALPKDDGNYIDLYVPDSMNENSFNYIFYTDSANVFYDSDNEMPLEWTMFENGYYNEQYKIRVLNNYDYTNDKFREV